MSKLNNHQNLPTEWAEREILRNSGQFWTPQWIAEAMVSYVIKGTDLIFDPAAGNGAFLQALQKFENPDISYYGIDIDDEVLSESIYQHENVFVELRDFIKNPPPKQFKAIVANPPYIRHHRLDRETKNILKRISTRNIGIAIDGRAGYHIYFLIQALSLLAHEGKLAFIMPADTCEGKSANTLWQWISNAFCIECVITFSDYASPFPNVDTNAIIFLIKKAKPINTIKWVKVTQQSTVELSSFILSNFGSQHFETLEFLDRDLSEAITTGLSRPVQNRTDLKFFLSDFATVKRGIVTGSNDFFFLTSERIRELCIPNEYFKRAIGRTKDVTGDILTQSNIHELDEKNRPTFLLSIDNTLPLPKCLTDYLNLGEKIGLPNSPLIQQRNPWYKMEKRQVPPILFAYLGRRSSRFVLNDADVVPLTAFLCVYPKNSDTWNVTNLWRALNHPDTLENLKFVGKSYGSGSIKVEPSGLANLPIPEHLVKQFDLLPISCEMLPLFN